MTGTVLSGSVAINEVINNCGGVHYIILFFPLSRSNFPALKFVKRSSRCKCFTNLFSMQPRVIDLEFVLLSLIQLLLSVAMCLRQDICIHFMVLILCFEDYCCTSKHDSV